MPKGGFVYIMTNVHHTVFYTGVTSQLYVRMTQHRDKFYKDSFTARYNICKLVYYEVIDSISVAIDREKQIKKYSRIKKLALIEMLNPEWKDLFEEISQW